jgi:hypothetical protein
MMVLGFLAVAVPILATLAVEIFVGWLLFIAGLFRVVWVWRSRQMPGFAWSLLTAVLAIILGFVYSFDEPAALSQVHELAGLGQLARYGQKIPDRIRRAKPTVARLRLSLSSIRTNNEPARNH